VFEQLEEKLEHLIFPQQQQQQQHPAADTAEAAAAAEAAGGTATGVLNPRVCPVCGGRLVLKPSSLIGGFIGCRWAFVTSHYITSHHITLHYITLHYITLHYITLHYIRVQLIHTQPWLGCEWSHEFTCIRQSVCIMHAMIAITFACCGSCRRGM
jgi:hypothetical protein